MANTRNEDIAAGVASHINQLAASLQVNKGDLQRVVDVVAEHIDAYGKLPKDDAEALKVFTDKILPEVLADKRLSDLASPPPPPPVGVVIAPVAPLVAAAAGLIVLAEVGVAAYLIYRELQDVPTVSGNG